MLRGLLIHSKNTNYQTIWKNSFITIFGTLFEFLSVTIIMSSRVLKNILFGFLLFTCLSSYSQTTYYVSKSGNNSNAGNFGAPFLTVSHAVSVINPGDQIYIREGVYHENIVFNNIDATSGNETLISSYNNEEVIIDGTIKVSTTWADDTIGGVQVKKLENFTNSITQLFVGNNQMVMARWPNAQFSD